MSCHYCGSDVPESESTCPVCGMSAVEQPALVTSMSVAFEPGSSFVDVPEQDLDFGGIPGWLQTFGESVAANPVAHLDPPIPSAFTDARAEPTLPAWLEEPRAVPSVAPVVSSLVGDVLASDDSSGFISEDDLPEWLRSLGDETTGELVVAGIAAPSASNGVLSIPNTTLAWVAAHQMVALAPGETLFARIAGEEAAQAPAVAADAPHHVEIAAMQSLATPAADVAPPATPRNNMRLLLLAALIMGMVLLTLVMATQA